jgi:hypothetical protein
MALAQSNENMLIVSEHTKTSLGAKRPSSCTAAITRIFRLGTSTVECVVAQNLAFSIYIPRRLLTFTGLTSRATTFQSQTLLRR